MTPDRAYEIVKEYVRWDRETYDEATAAILNACREQERETRHKALTEAMRICRDAGYIDVEYQIELLRDGG